MRKHNALAARKNAMRWLSQLPRTKEPEWIRGHTDDGLPDWATYFVYPATLSTLVSAVVRLDEEGVRLSARIDSFNEENSYIFIIFKISEMESDPALCSLIPKREDESE